MPYYIQCTDSDCGKVTSVDDISDLIYGHLSEDGWIECPVCDRRGFIDSWDEGGRRAFRQDKSLPGPKKYLKAIIKLHRSPPLADGSQERNFVFLVSRGKAEPPDHIWPARYWKDGTDQWRVFWGPLLSLSEVGKMMDHLDRPEGEWGLGLHVPRY